MVFAIYKANRKRESINMKKYTVNHYGDEFLVLEYDSSLIRPRELNELYVNLKNKLEKPILMLPKGTTLSNYTMEQLLIFKKYLCDAMKNKESE